MAGGTSKPNIVVVSVDCLRRDRLSAYGYGRSTTPFIDRLLDVSLHASSAHSTSSWTAPAVASLFTGLYPHHHGAGVIAGDMKNVTKKTLPSAVSSDVTTLPEILDGHGYRTASFIAVWNADLPFRSRFGHVLRKETSASRLLRRALDWTTSQSGPFLAWIHLGDTHEPLRVPLGGRNVFGRIPRDRAIRRWEFTKRDDDVGGERFRRYREARIRLYDAAVCGVDKRIRRFCSALDRARLRDRTVLVITSDHGEEFWEHREDEVQSFADPRNIAGTGHGHNLFQVHILVPLIVQARDLEPREISSNVSLIDVVPTLLELVGVDPPPIDGVSLTRNPEPLRPILSESIAYGFEKKSVVVGDHKLLSSPGDGYERVFALGADRTEAGIVDDDSLARALRAHLPGEPPMVGDETELTDEIEEHLRDLGYLE